jgi:hypothetical protein
METNVKLMCTVLIFVGDLTYVIICTGILLFTVRFITRCQRKFITLKFYIYYQDIYFQAIKFIT